ncbi:MAG TPA: hypothetical protein VN849_12710 [Stellaceae bacterium]|nr:hypothetical protein [Stellaceae bacterium]
MKAITAAVIAILNVNIRFRPLAHRRSGAKRGRGARGAGTFGGRPSVGGIVEGVNANFAPFAGHSSLLTWPNCGAESGLVD